MSVDPLVWAVPWLGIVVHTETWFALAGIAIGIAAIRVAARQRGLLVPSYADLVGVVFWAVVIGRAWYGAEHWQFFAGYPLALFGVVDGGLALPGMLLGALWGLRELVRATGLTWPVLAALVASALAAARSVQLTGCVLTGCVIGPPLTLARAYVADPPQHPVALYGVLLLAAAWFIASRTSTGRISAWLPVAAYVSAEFMMQVAAAAFAVPTA
jgi:hypothetical protein